MQKHEYTSEKNTKSIIKLLKILKAFKGEVRRNGAAL